MISGAEKISAIVLAAGQSKRMGQNKLLMDVSGKPMLQRTLDLIDSVGFGEKILVTARWTADAVNIPRGFKLVYNHDGGEGQSLSVQLGVTAAACDYYMFFLGDMPFLDESSVRQIIGAIDGESIIVPYADGEPRNPVIFPKSFRDELLSLRGDSGGRSIIDANKASCKAVLIKDGSPLQDVDTIEDYLILKQK